MERKIALCLRCCSGCMSSSLEEGWSPLDWGEHEMEKVGEAESRCAETAVSKLPMRRM